MITTRCPAALPRSLPLIAGMLLALTAGRATTVLPPSFSELVNESDYVVRAVVKSVESKEQAATAGHGPKIYTYVEVQVTQVIAGHPPTPLVLRLLGGKVGTHEMILQGAPQFKVGDEDILFVQGNGQQIYPLARMMHGRYPVKQDAKTGQQYIARFNSVPLHDVSEVGLPAVEGSAAALQQRLAASAPALTPDQFVQQIRGAVKPDNRTRLEY